MDYLDIVLNGYFDENNREHLEKYFFREFKKANKNYYEADEFFGGCIKIIESWEHSLKDRIDKRKEQLYLMLGGAEDGTLRYNDLQGKNIEQERKKTIEYCKEELKEERPDGIGSMTYKIHLPSLTKGRILYNMPYNEVLIIKKAISKAYEKAQNETLTPQQNSKQKPEQKKTELSERIKKHFGFFNGNCPRKHKQILNNNDFDKLIEWSIWYFENDFKVPKISEPISIVNTNKTYVQLAFRHLFKELHKTSPYPESLFNFYKSAFKPYSNDKKNVFDKVRNNDEVKKLMQIDY